MGTKATGRSTRAKKERLAESARVCKYISPKTSILLTRRSDARPPSSSYRSPHSTTPIVAFDSDHHKQPPRGRPQSSDYPPRRVPVHSATSTLAARPPRPPAHRVGAPDSRPWVSVRPSRKLIRFLSPPSRGRHPLPPYLSRAVQNPTPRSLQASHPYRRQLSSRDPFLVGVNGARGWGLHRPEYACHSVRALMFRSRVSGGHFVRRRGTFVTLRLVVSPRAISVSRGLPSIRRWSIIAASSCLVVISSHSPPFHLLVFVHTISRAQNVTGPSHVVHVTLRWSAREDHITRMSR